MKLHRRLVKLASRLVPRRVREDWTREWEAELRHREAQLEGLKDTNHRVRRDLVRRSAGAVWDALALQPRRLEQIENALLPSYSWPARPRRSESSPCSSRRSVCMA